MNEYQVGLVFFDDEDYPNKAEYCNAQGLAIIEIEPDDKGRRRFQIQEVVRTEKDELFNEIGDINEWFDMYDMQCKQIARCQRLGIPYDNKYGTPEELDREAEKKSARLNEIYKIINN